MIGRRARTGTDRLRRIIVLCLLAAATLVTLAGCTATRLAYQQAPQLSQWWLDGHFDFDDAQAVQAREEIDAFFDWHRRHELPRYGELLRRWQAMAQRDLGAEEVCAEFEVIRERLWHAGERSLEPFTRLLLRLGPDQIAYLQARQARSNRDFAEDFLRGPPARRLEHRLEQAVSRSERLYGTLDDRQRALLREWLARSPWDPRATQAERLRRQADLRQTIARMQAEPSRAEALLRGHGERLLRSGDPAYRAMSDAAVRHGCAQFAALHNSTTPGQRAYAVRELQGYEEDLVALSAPR